MKYNDSNIDNWPNTWAGVPEDIQYGKTIIKLFRNYIKSLKDRKLAIKTINRHINNLWVLGGFIIKKINCNPDLRNKPALLLLPRFIDSWDGPNIYDLSESGQEEFDRTCRDFYKYLAKNDLKKMIDSGVDFFD